MNHSSIAIRSIAKILAIVMIISLPIISHADEIILKIATLAPEGSVWMNELQAMNDSIQKLSGNRVKFRFYPGGVMGDDKVILRKMRVGQLDGAGFTSAGVVEVYPDFQVLNIPRLFKNDAEVDFVLKALVPEMNDALKKKGYIALGFTSLGFTYLFSQNPLNSADDLRKTKAWLIENDVIMNTWFSAAGMAPVAVGIGDVLTALQTGLLDTVFNTPGGILALQWFTKINYMVDYPLTHAFATVLISERSWKKIPADIQQIIMDEATKYIQKITDHIREDDRRALEVIVQNGVKVQKDRSPTFEKEIDEIANKATQKLLNEKIQSPLYTRVKSILNDYRNAKHP